MCLSGCMNVLLPVSSTLSRVFPSDAQENNLSGNAGLAETKQKMDALDAELTKPTEHKLTPIAEDGGSDVADWNDFMAPYYGQTWLEAPWLYGEFYVYRRIIEAFQWFRGGPDPFESQKQLGVTSSLASMDALAVRLLDSDKLVSVSRFHMHFRIHRCWNFSRVMTGYLYASQCNRRLMQG